MDENFDPYENFSPLLWKTSSVVMDEKPLLKTGDPASQVNKIELLAKAIITSDLKQNTTRPKSQLKNQKIRLHRLRCRSIVLLRSKRKKGGNQNQIKKSITCSFAASDQPLKRLHKNGFSREKGGKTNLPRCG